MPVSEPLLPKQRIVYLLRLCFLSNLHNVSPFQKPPPVHYTSADLLPYGKFRIVESEAPNGYLTDGAKPIDFTITENGKIVDLTDKAHSIYNQIKRGDIEGVKIGAGTHKRLADVPFRITSKTTGEHHVVVTDDNGQFSTSAEWASHKHNTNAGKTSEDGVWSVSYTHLALHFFSIRAIG